MIISSLLYYTIQQINLLKIHIIIKMSKKKAEEKKQIIPIFQKGIFWQYKQYPKQTCQKVDNFLTNFNLQLKALIDNTKTLEENYQIIAGKMGFQIHPCLKNKLNKEQSNFPTLKSNDYGQKYVIFLSHKIDIVTLKLFGLLLSQIKLNTLKFSNNSLNTEQIIEIQKILEKEQSLTTLFFQWNPLIDNPSRKQIFLSITRPSLQHLVLRQCKIGDHILKEMLVKINSFPQSKLKSLDLYGNQITVDLKEQLCSYIQTNKTLQFVGLSKNKLNTEDFLLRLFRSFGEIKLTSEEYDQHKQKQKLRDQIIQKNKKRKKGSPQQLVPFVFELKQTENGKFYVKNTSVKILNISSNGIDDRILVPIRKFVQNNGKNIQIFVEDNKFSKASKDSLKFYENVIC